MGRQNFRRFRLEPLNWRELGQGVMQTTVLHKGALLFRRCWKTNPTHCAHGPKSRYPLPASSQAALAWLDGPVAKAACLPV